MISSNVSKEGGKDEKLEFLRKRLMEVEGGEKSAGKYCEMLKSGNRVIIYSEDKNTSIYLAKNKERPWHGL